jgi:hypothetical protein
MIPAQIGCLIEPMVARHRLTGSLGECGPPASAGGRLPSVTNVEPQERYQTVRHRVRRNFADLYGTHGDVEAPLSMLAVCRR